jgi:small-conductance mechanosensitive channel
VPRALTAEELGRFFVSLLQPTALVELAVFFACLLAAWAAVRLMRGATPRPESIWFGSGVIDGVLFPVLALLFAVLARWVLADQLPIVVFRLVVPILVSLLVIRLTVRVLHSAFPDSQFMRVVERSVSWVAWIAVVLWIIGALPVMLDELDAIQWRIGTSRISLRNLLEGLITAVVVLVLALWISAALERKLLKGATDNLSARKMAANILRSVLVFIGLMFALSAAGIDLTALGVLGGALGVGIGFGLQKLAANYISGFVILAERSVRIGDTVKVDNFEGRIIDINTRYTVLRAASGREAVVPNEMMMTQRVENSSRADPKLNLTTSVQVAYGTDLDVLIPRLTALVAAVPRVMREPGASVMLSAFAADGLELTVSFWVADPDNGQGNVKSAVNLVVLRLLGESGIEIAYPKPAARPG